MSDLIQLRRGTAAEWAAADPVLEEGEPGFEIDTNTFKLGDGSTAWSALDPIAGGGGGSPWTLAVNNPLSSLAGFTSSGPWAISSGVTRQSATDAAVRRHILDAKVPLAGMVAECEIKLDVTTSTVSSRAGFSFGGENNSVLVALLAGVAGNTSAIDYEEDSVTNLGGNDALAANIPHGTWITFRVIKFGRSVSAYVNGAFVGSADYATRQQVSKFSLYTYATDASFRNLKLWTPTLP